jgi:AraC-like DNA-binding protein
MPSQPWQETSIDGARSRLWKVDADECPEMKAHRIARMGWHEAVAPYARVRLKPGGSFFLACVEGEGRILLDGRWQRVTRGAVFLAPPRLLNAFHAAPGKRLVFAWVRYEEPPGTKPLVGATSPVRGAGGAWELARAVEGLRAEWEGARAPRVVHHWLSLVMEFTARLARPWAAEDRLWKLWEQVAADLAAPWSLIRLGDRAHMSGEHLRRLCLKTLGRSPMHHVTYMRMQRAQELLETTNDKLEVIAPMVGYDDALVFSRAFKRWVGLNPTEYRGRR